LINSQEAPESIPTLFEHRGAELLIMLWGLSIPVTLSNMGNVILTNPFFGIPFAVLNDTCRDVKAAATYETLVNTTLLIAPG